MKELNNVSGYIHPFRVHVPNLLNETFVNACRPKDLAALRIPLNEFTRYLRTLTQRCAELNDPVLNKIMIDMTMYEESDLASKEYDQGLVDQVNKNYREYLDGGLSGLALDLHRCKQALNKISEYGIAPTGETEMQRIKRLKAIADKALFLTESKK